MTNNQDPRSQSKSTLWATVILAAALLGAAALLMKQRTSERRVPAETALPVRVVYKANANYLIYFVAREKGFLKQAGLAIKEVEMESSNLMIQALAGDQADFNPSAAVPPLYAAEQNAPGTFKFVYITLMEKGAANDAITVKKNSPIKTLTELRGKRVGCPPGATGLVLLKMIFSRAGLVQGKDFFVEELEPRSQLQALAAGEIDGLLAIEPIITLGEEKGISRVLESEPIENHIMNPIPVAGGVVTARFLKSNPEAAKRLQSAMDRTIDYIRQREDQCRITMGKAIGMPDRTVKRLGINTYWKIGEANRGYVQKLADLFLEQGALQRVVQTTNMYAGKTQ